MRRALAVIALLLLAACQKAPPPQPVQEGFIPAELGKPFSLHTDEAAMIASENVKVYFRGVTADSRCPSDVTCIWAGEARVELVVLQHSEVLGRYDVLVGGEPIAFRNYTLAAAGLEPYPVSTRQIAPAEYLATLTVRRM